MAYLIVSKCRLFCIGGIVATRAGDVSIPTVLGASRSFRVVTYLIVSECRLFCIGGIVATRAGNVSVPSVLSASGCFSLVSYLVVSKSRLLCIGRVITSGASNVGIPAVLSASGCFSLVSYLVVSERRLLCIGRVVASGASNVSIPTDLGTGGSLRIVNYNLVVQRHYNGLRYNDLVADRAVLAFSESRIGTIGRNYIIDYLGMPKRIDKVILICISAGASIRSISLLCTGGLYHRSGVIMPFCCYLLSIAIATGCANAGFYTLAFTLGFCYN